MAAGKDVLSYCSRCKMDLAHVIIAEVSGDPEKVSCKTCGSVHKYRPGKTTKKIKKKTVKKSSSKKKTTKKTDSNSITLDPETYAIWQNLVENKEAVATQPYKMKSTYEKKDCIKHTTFGSGLVIKTLPKKIEVLFETGLKILVHSRS